MTRKTWRTMRALFDVPEGQLFTVGPWNAHEMKEPDPVYCFEPSYAVMYQPVPPWVRYIEDDGQGRRA